MIGVLPNVPLMGGSEGESNVVAQMRLFLGGEC